MTTYTGVCIRCPIGQQRQPERDSADLAVSDLDCAHPGKVLQIWSSVIEQREVDDELVDVEVRTVTEVPL